MDQIPTRNTCDLTDPEEMFLWCFTGAGGVTGAPLLMPTDYYRALSRHLHDCGARLTAEPVVKWRAPTDTLSPLLAQGEWVPADEPDKEDEVTRIVSQLTPELRRRTLEVLREMGGDPDDAA